MTTKTADRRSSLSFEYGWAIHCDSCRQSLVPNVHKMGLFKRNSHNQMKLWWNSWTQLLIRNRSLCECFSTLEGICNRPIRKRSTKTFRVFIKSTPSLENFRKLVRNVNINISSVEVKDSFILILLQGQGQWPVNRTHTDKEGVENGSKFVKK